MPVEPLLASKTAPNFTMDEIEAIFHQMKRLQALFRAAGDDNVGDPKALRALGFILEGTKASTLCERLADALEREELNKIADQFEPAEQDAAVSMEEALSNIRLHME